MVQTKQAAGGQGHRPLVGKSAALRGWTIIDNRGNKVDVALTDVQTGMQLADSLFKYDGPDAGQILRGGNRN